MSNPFDVQALHAYHETYERSLHVPFSLIGFAWLPELLLSPQHEINDYFTLAGIGVHVFTLLVTIQVFGMPGAIIHTLVYGAGMAVHAFMSASK
jgi:hypothetical protein